MQLPVREQATNLFVPRGRNWPIPQHDPDRETMQELGDSRSNKRQKRRPIACARCHAQKIRCSGEQPCRGCELAKKPEECQYPTRDRNVTVPESYLDRLEKEIQSLKAQRSVQNAEPLVEAPTSLGHNHQDLPAVECDVPNPLLEDQDSLFAGQSSAHFVGEASCTAFGDRLLQSIDPSYQATGSNAVPDHITHPAFRRLASKDFVLPSRVQATLLVRRAHSFIGNNYHLFEKKSFFDKLDRAYSPQGSTDLVFVCHLFAVLAIGELYSHYKNNEADGRVPGTTYFVQAVKLLQDVYEVASVEQVQICMLISFYANTLGRVKSAHVYCGIALRVGIGLGLHRAQSGSSTTTAVQRENRRRVWWTLYLFDRLISSKLGYPLAIRDEDIDVEYPSMEGLTPAEQAEFCDPVHMCAHASLAKITGSILSDIYRLPRQSNPTFVHRVHRVLTDLRQWEQDLPAALRLCEERPPRNISNLHLQYHLCIIQTTRPILLHIFKTRLQASRALTDKEPRATFSPTTLALADACVQAARTMNQLLSKLFVEGTLALYGYFDSHYLFSSTLVLIISTVMDPNAVVSDSVQTALSLLRSMANHGNPSASDYIARLEQIRAKTGSPPTHTEPLAHAGPDIAGPDQGPVSNDAAPSSDFTAVVDPSQPLWDPARFMLPGDEMQSEDPLGNPFIESFLAEKAFQWPGTISPEQDVLRQFAQELGDEFVFGS